MAHLIDVEIMKVAKESNWEGIKKNRMREFQPKYSGDDVMLIHQKYCWNGLKKQKNIQRSKVRKDTVEREDIPN